MRTTRRRVVQKAWRRSSPPVGQPAVDAHRALRLGAEAVVGQHDDVGVRAHGVDQPADRAIELLVHRQQRGTDVVVERAVGRAVGVDVLPEVVLHAIGRVEDDAHRVGRAARHHAQRGLAAQPRLSPHAVQVGERALVVVGIRPAQVLRRRQVDLVLAQLRRHLRWVGERLARRREHAADQVAVGDRTQRVGRRHVDDADALPGMRRDVPDAGGAQVGGVGEAGGVVAVERHAVEREDAVPAGILAGHERRPGRQGERRHRGRERSPRPAVHERGQRRQAAGPRPRREQVPASTVEPDDEYAGRQAGGR